jgi:hypothetical protein
MNHVVGSAALVERLWSVARYILTYERSNMAPELLEAILFLYYNRDSGLLRPFIGLIVL